MFHKASLAFQSASFSELAIFLRIRSIACYNVEQHDSLNTGWMFLKKSVERPAVCVVMWYESAVEGRDVC